MNATALQKKIYILFGCHCDSLTLKYKSVTGAAVLIMHERVGDEEERLLSRLFGP